MKVGPYFLLVGLVSANSLDHGIFDWVNSFDGGYVNPRMEMRREFPDDETSIIGVFATETIEEGQLLVRVPWENTITGFPVELEDYETDEDYERALLLSKCEVIRKLSHEMKLGNSSEYAPYINYLNDQPAGQLPEWWSEEGKELLKTVLGWSQNDNVSELPPKYSFHWLDQIHEEWCGFSMDDEITKKAAMLVMQRADDDTLIPAYDSLNHRNGKEHHNARIEYKRGKGNSHRLYASQRIEKGQQLHISYNFCDMCENRYHNYGTPDIFAEYGFIEPMPQKWIFFDEEVIFELDELDDDEKEDEDDKIGIYWNSELPQEGGYRDELRKKLKKHVFRLVRTRNWAFNLMWNDGNPDIPENEWNMIWMYHQAMTDALSLAYNSIVVDDVLPNSWEGEQTCSAENPTSLECGYHYDMLQDEEDDLDYTSPTCNLEDYLYFTDYETAEELDTSYQEVIFNVQPETGDVCMDLDTILQICSSYRPQYHEFVHHFPARYVETVKRVVFVGGGDSMLLHEALKYPSLEQVVGLELDQTVVRKSFKYFNTQPHFDDDRVEWWFGDATKTLLLLPKHYWGSFDLVLIDLSETVMALSVTEDLDVFDALALLLKPEGVMVKNELYIEEMSEVFDYTIQIRYDSPKICQQVLAMGSNKADFFHQTTKDHHVPNLLLLPKDQIKDPYEYIHGYRKNDARLQGKCNMTSNSSPEVQVQTKAAGIMHIVDAERISKKFDLESLVYAALHQTGLTPISTQKPGDSESTVTVAVFTEGYVIARSWPDRQYVAFGINLWGAFQKEFMLKQHLLQAVHSDANSSFRVVVGGMYNSKTWKEDMSLMGPQIVQNRNCDITEKENPSIDSSMDEGIPRSTIDEVISLAHGEDLIAGVVCGFESKDPCLTKDILEKHPTVQQVVTFWACPELSNDESDEVALTNKLPKMFACENAMLDQIDNALTPDDLYFTVFAMDSSAPFEMAQIFNSIWSIRKHRDWYIEEEHNLFLGVSLHPEREIYQRNFLDRYRKDVGFEPTSRAEFIIRSEENTMEIGIVSVGDDFIFHNLKVMEDTIKRRITADRKIDFDIELKKVVGAAWEFKENFEPREFSHDDYDNAPGMQQFLEQEPLGRETHFQFVLDGKEEAAKMPSLDEMDSYLVDSLLKLDFTEIVTEKYTDIGDGGVVVALSNNGSAVLVWDGKDHVDVNLFNLNDDKKFADSFSISFIEFSNKNLVSSLRDDYPRGTGRVINFKADLNPEQNAPKGTHKKPSPMVFD